MLITRKLMSCWLMMLALLCGCAVATAAPFRLDDLHRDVWTAKEGAPSDICAMTQTADGWLWLSTGNGLYRFDGVRFARYQPRPDETLLESSLTTLYAAPDGALWFGYSAGGGVSVLRNGRLTLHSPPGIGSLYQAHQGQDGTLWFATGKGLWRYTDGVWHKIGAQDGVPDGVAIGSFVDQYGRVWATIGGRLLVRRQPGERFALAAPASTDDGITAAPDGRLWTSIGDRFTLAPPPDAVAVRPVSQGYDNTTAGQWVFDRAGNLWTTECATGLCMTRAAAMAGRTAFRLAALPQDARTSRQHKPPYVRSLLEDAEGNMWAATADGLERYRPQRIHHVPLDEQHLIISLANDGPNALWVAAKRTGQLWRMTDAALTRIPGQFDYAAVDGFASTPTLFSGKRGIEQRAHGRSVAAIVRTADGQPLPPVNAIASAFDGADYWAQDSARGPVKLVDGSWRSAAELGFPAGARAFHADPQGHIWLRYEDRIVDAARAPGIAYGKAGGIDLGRLQRIDLHQDTIVLGNTGIAVKIGARFYPLRPDRPELLVNALASIHSANGDLWINAYGGLIRVQAADWKAWLAQPGGILKTTLFDGADGYPGGHVTLTTRMATTDDGKRVWFASKQGLAWIDSTTIVQNRIAPRVQVLQLRTGTQAYAGAGALRLAAGTRNIGIDFTALSFAMPERLRFRYRLAGLDDNWQEGGARRAVDYTNLGPGTYNFEVVAANEDGVWGIHPATLRFTIAPLFTQTWWFFALCALTAVSALALLYRARVRSVRRHLADRMHERLHERERIARTLHDTYLQSVQGLIYVFHDVAQREPAANGSRHAMDRALEMADDVLIQGREQVLGLRMSARGDATLAESLGEVGQALEKNYSMACNVSTTGPVQALREPVLEDLFYIGREALLNAFRHSRGSRVDVRLHYGLKAFTLHIEDDGTGLPLALLAEGNRAGHWGLPGMRERADNLDGVLAIANGHVGARIVLTVPGRSVYAGQRPAWRALARQWSP